MYVVVSVAVIEPWRMVAVVAMVVVVIVVLIVCCANTKLLNGQSNIYSISISQYVWRELGITGHLLMSSVIFFFAQNPVLLRAI